VVDTFAIYDIATRKHPLCVVDNILFEDCTYLLV
jgi:hypothetical protein